MARIAFAWELGGELGHAMACNTLALELRARGHRIAFVFRELSPLAYLDPCAAHDVFQAPITLTEGRGAAGKPFSLADILGGCGYDRPSHVAGLLGGWLSIFERWRPDLVVTDFAPTALLAARALGLRRVAYGNGFSIPPRTTPLAPFRFDDPIAPGYLEASDARALGSANIALARWGAPPLAALAEQFEADEEFLFTFPELDAYAKRPASGYWGPGFNSESGVPVAWPEGEGKRVAVYVRKRLPQLDGLIDALVAQDCRVAAFIPDLDAKRVARLRSPRRIVSERPMRLGPLLAGCDLFVSHGGGACAGTLAAGIPQLIFPAQYEQYLTALRVAQIRAGVLAKPNATAAEVAMALAQLLGQSAHAEAAKAFAARYPGYTPREHVRRVIARIEEILARPSRWPRLVRTPLHAILAPTPNAPASR